MQFFYRRLAESKVLQEQRDAKDSELPAQPQAADADTVSPAPEADETQAEENEAEAKSPGSNETKGMRWELALAGVLGVAVILGLVVIYFKLDDIRDANLATSQTVREFGVLDERAWMVPVGVDSPLAVGIPLSISAKVVNKGKTPAKRCAAYVFATNLKYPEVPKLSIMDSQGNAQSPSSLLIAPGQQISFPPAETPQAVSKGLFDSVQFGEVRTFILVKLTYDDVFKAHHWIEFCYVFDPLASQWVTSGNAITDDDK